MHLTAKQVREVGRVLSVPPDVLVDKVRVMIKGHLRDGIGSEESLE